jgi:hypothetical protein
MGLLRCNVDTRRYRHNTAASPVKLMHRRSRAKSPTGNMPYDLSPGDRRSHDASCTRATSTPSCRGRRRGRSASAVSAPTPQSAATRSSTRRPDLDAGDPNELGAPYRATPAAAAPQCARRLLRHRSPKSFAASCRTLAVALYFVKTHSFRLWLVVADAPDPSGTRSVGHPTLSHS